MPFRLPFTFPPFYSNYRYNNYKHHHYNISAYKGSNTINPFNSLNKNTSINAHSYFNEKNQFATNNYIKKEDSGDNQSSESFFDIFGLKLYFDDILIVCVLLFLFTENVQDEELFICLILLLLA